MLFFEIFWSGIKGNAKASIATRSLLKSPGLKGTSMTGTQFLIGIEVGAKLGKKVGRLVGLRVAILTVTDSTRIEALTADSIAFKHSSEVRFPYISLESLSESDDTAFILKDVAHKYFALRLLDE